MSRLYITVGCCYCSVEGSSSVPRLGLETELCSEKEQRQSLQRALQREQDNSTELRTQLQQLQGLHMVSLPSSL